MRKAALSASAVLLLTLSWSASAKARDQSPAKPLRADAAIDVVQKIYDKAERYTAVAGTPVEFAVSDCRAIYQRDFSREAYSELFDLSPGRVLELKATLLTDSGLGVSGASFLARWTDPFNEASSWATLAAVQGASVEEILTRMRTEDQKYNVRIEPIVSCSIAAVAAGESRSYRAAFFFSPGSDEAPRFFADSVVQGLSRLASESLPPTRDFTELRRRLNPDQGSGSPADPMNKAICEASTSTRFGSSLSLNNTMEHMSGSHSSQFAVQALCRLTSDCFSQCTPSISSSSCQESGELNTTFHHTHQIYRQDSLASDQKYLDASYCSGALGCAIESCLFGLCDGISFTAGYQGSGITLTPGANALWNGSLSSVVGCPAPERIIVRPPRCGELRVDSTHTFTMEGASGPTLAKQQIGFGLSRGEERSDGSFILEEWAVLSFEGEQPRVTSASSAAYGERVLSAAASLRPSGNQSTVLVVEDAEHPLNSRHIPLPTVAPIGREVRLPKSAGKQQLWFRAEVGVDGKVDRMEVLDASKNLDSELVQAELSKSLKLQFADQRRHRAVIFGIAEVEDGRIWVRKPHVSLPKCCCGNSFCV